LGSGFGTRDTTLLIFDRFDQGEFSPAWGNVNDLTISASHQRTPFSCCNGHLNFTSASRRGFFQGPSSPVASQWYVSYWFYLDQNWDWGTTGYGGDNQFLSNIKVFRMWNASTSIDENFLVSYAGWVDSWIFNMEYVAGPSSNGKYVGLARERMSRGQWHHFQFEFAENSVVRASDGRFRMWLDGKLLADRSDLLTREDFSQLKRAAVIGFDAVWGTSSGESDDSPNDFYIHDPLIATSWARVELANAPIYLQATHREDQIVTNWSDSAIVLTVNQGSFASDTGLYLFVLDADGQVNSPGFPVGMHSPPEITLTAPLNNATFIAPANIEISAVVSDSDGGISRVEFYEGTNLIGTGVSSPFAVAWSDVPPGNYTLMARVIDNAGVTNASSEVPVTVVSANTVALCPSDDTFLNLNTVSYADSQMLNTYTWPDFQIANAILMKFDLSDIHGQSSIENAALALYLVQSDPTSDPLYSISVHKIINKNPVLPMATGRTYDGTNSWTTNSCCYQGFPLAQSDISAAYAHADVDKIAGFKVWPITQMVQEWLNAPETNYGLLLNSDPSRFEDRYRFFASLEHTNRAYRPVLFITYKTLAATLSKPILNGKTFTFAFVAATNALYSVQFTDSLSPVNWKTIIGFKGIGTQVDFFDSFDAKISRFYRVKAE